MKKVLSLLLAVVMMAAMAVSAFATNESSLKNDGDSTSFDVSGVYVPATEEPVISVAITWGKMEFTYSAGGNVWHPEDHSSTPTNQGWSAEGNDITIVNHSNVGVTAALSFTAEVSGVVGEFVDSNNAKVTSVSLARAEKGSALESQSAVVYLNIIEGSITQSTSKLGKVTIKITKKA